MSGSGCGIAALGCVRPCPSVSDRVRPVHTVHTVHIVRPTACPAPHAVVSYPQRFQGHIQMSAPRSDQQNQHQHVLARLKEAGTELAIVLGPEDSQDPGSHWVGAVLSIVGNTAGYPTVFEAAEDGLFHPGSGRYLAAFHLDRTPPERAEKAQAATKLAWDTMQAHRSGPEFGSLRPSAESADAASHASDPAAAYARNTRLKFERVYEAARRAFADKNRRTALDKCRAALDLLQGEDIYGESQPRVEQELARRIEALERK